MTNVIQKGLTIIKITPTYGDTYEGEDQNSQYKRKNTFIKSFNNIQ